jgi:hypothetical protein
MTVPSRADAPAAVLMALIWLSFGLVAILWPAKLKTAIDNFASKRNDGWHPYKMSLPLLRMVVGVVGLGGAALFALIAYRSLSR